MGDPCTFSLGFSLTLASHLLPTRVTRCQNGVQGTKRKRAGNVQLFSLLLTNFFIVIRPRQDISINLQMLMAHSPIRWEAKRREQTYFVDITTHWCTHNSGSSGEMPVTCPLLAHGRKGKLSCACAHSVPCVKFSPLLATQFSL